MGESLMNAKWVLFFSLLLIVLVDVGEANDVELLYETDSKVVILNAALETEDVKFKTLKAIYR